MYITFVYIIDAPEEIRRLKFGAIPSQKLPIRSIDRLVSLLEERNKNARCERSLKRLAVRNPLSDISNTVTDVCLCER